MELLQGCEYEFRVSAENIVGVGDPSPPSKPAFAKDPIGEIRVIAELHISSARQCTTLIHCVLTVKPSPPVNLKAIDHTKESVTLSWEPPTETGRGKIFGYLLEFQKAGEEEWIKVRLSSDVPLCTIIMSAQSLDKPEHATCPVLVPGAFVHRRFLCY